MSSCPLSSPRMLFLAISWGVWPSSASSSILVTSVLILFSASYASVKIVAGNISDERRGEDEVPRPRRGGPATILLGRLELPGGGSSLILAAPVRVRPQPAPQRRVGHVRVREVVGVHLGLQLRGIRVDEQARVRGPREAPHDVRRRPAVPLRRLGDDAPARLGAGQVGRDGVEALLRPGGGGGGVFLGDSCLHILDAVAQSLCVSRHEDDVASLCGQLPACLEACPLGAARNQDCLVKSIVRLAALLGFLFREVRDILFPRQETRSTASCSFPRCSGESVAE
ncbi:hypothetical protein FJTKL_09186 [Diaporthe vaccinii]|uniref:Uncharacterized protein n=1 Tax=Diaporthe vaccinii TaxID=105482 RepID=A0ABR4EP52_9PEZI